MPCSAIVTATLDSALDPLLYSVILYSGTLVRSRPSRPTPSHGPRCCACFSATLGRRTGQDYRGVDYRPAGAGVRVRVRGEGEGEGGLYGLRATGYVLRLRLRLRLRRGLLRHVEIRRWCCPGRQAARLIRRGRCSISSRTLTQPSASRSAS